MASEPTSKHNFGWLDYVAGVVFIVAVIAVAMLTFHHRTPTTTSSGSTTTNNTSKTALAELQDSGSTNAAGWDLIIYSDGSGKAGGTNFAAGTFAAGPLKQSLASTPLEAKYSCIRSVSFGTVQTLIYNGRSTVGVDCYVSANPEAGLSKNLRAAIKAARL